MKFLPYIMLVCLTLFMTMGLWLMSEDPSIYENTKIDTISQDTSIIHSEACPCLPKI